MLSFFNLLLIFKDVLQLQISGRNYDRNGSVSQAGLQKIGEKITIIHIFIMNSLSFIFSSFMKRLLSSQEEVRVYCRQSYIW